MTDASEKHTLLLRATYSKPIMSQNFQQLMGDRQARMNVTGCTVRTRDTHESSSTSTKLTATASANQGSSSPALMRMGLDAERVDATAFLSAGVGTKKAEAPPKRSATVHATYFGAMIPYRSRPN